MKSKFSWFQLNRALHRDVGFFCVGLTLIYAISGIALNHIEDWNPNYAISVREVPASLPAEGEEQSFIGTFLEEQEIDRRLKSFYWAAPNEFKVFLKEVVITFNGHRAQIEETVPRALLFEMNFLHLNTAKKGWTYFADFYAFLLIFLSLSALFMVKGKKGALGRGGIYLVLGIITPLFFLWLYL